MTRGPLELGDPLAIPLAFEVFCGLRTVVIAAAAIRRIGRANADDRVAIFELIRRVLRPEPEVGPRETASVASVVDAVVVGVEALLAAGFLILCCFAHLSSPLPFSIFAAAFFVRVAPDVHNFTLLAPVALPDLPGAAGRDALLARHLATIVPTLLSTLDNVLWAFHSENAVHAHASSEHAVIMLIKAGLAILPCFGAHSLDLLCFLHIVAALLVDGAANVLHFTLLGLVALPDLPRAA